MILRLNNIPNKLPNVSLNQKEYIRPKIGAGLYTPKDLLEKHLIYKLYAIDESTKIVSFAELIINNKIHVIEIYNLFTHSNYRGRKFASQIINQIKEDFPGYKLWLGIDQAVGNVNAKARLYKRHHFSSNIKLTNTTSFGNPIGRKIIQMVYKPGKLRIAPNTKTVNKVLALRNRPLSIRLKLSRDFLSKIQILRNLHVEYGGRLYVHYKGFRNTHYTYDVNQKKNNIVRGSENNYITNIPSINVNTKLLINWHTHPTICYRTEETCLGLPSSGDIVSFLKSFLSSNGKQICTFVFSEEGIYVIYINPDCIKPLLSINITSIIITSIINTISYLIDKAQQKQYLPKKFTKHIFGGKNVVHGFKSGITFFKTVGIINRNSFNPPKLITNYPINSIRQIYNNYKNIIESILLPGSNIPIFKMQLVNWGVSGDVQIDLPYIFSNRKRNSNINHMDIS